MLNNSIEVSLKQVTKLPLRLVFVVYKQNYRNKNIQFCGWKEKFQLITNSFIILTITTNLLLDPSVNLGISW